MPASPVQTASSIDCTSNSALARASDLSGLTRFAHARLLERFDRLDENQRASLASALVNTRLPGAFELLAYDLEKPVDLVVQTAEGQLRGERTNRLKIFRGVSYGESTGGKNRFRRAVPVQAWEGVRDALVYGPSCYQKSPDWAEFKDDTDGSEDCLNLKYDQGKYLYQNYGC